MAQTLAAILSPNLLRQEEWNVRLILHYRLGKVETLRLVVPV